WSAIAPWKWVCLRRAGIVVGSCYLGKRAASVDFARHDNLGSTQRVGYLRFAQARRVVFKRQLFLRIVQTKPPQAVNVRELAEMAQLLFAQGRLQFISHFHECHARIIPATTNSRRLQM